MIALIRDTVLRLRAEGVAVVLVEQRVETALSVADRVVFLVNGAVAEEVTAEGLTPEAEVFGRYVGV
jgi:branched-chain amino acid transport system ATP-binding protein